MNINNKNPLFIIDKWCSGNKLFGVSAWENNFIETHEQYANKSASAFHFDEYREMYNDHNANETLLSILKIDRPDYIFLVIYELPTESDRIINSALYERYTKNIKFRL